MKLKRGAQRSAKQDEAEAPSKARRGHVPGRGRRSTGEGDFSRATVFLPRPTREILAQHGIKHGMSLQEIVEAAMDEWMRQNGYPPFYPDGWSRQGRQEDT